MKPIKMFTHSAPPSLPTIPESNKVKSWGWYVDTSKFNRSTRYNDLRSHVSKSIASNIKKAP